VLIEAYGKIAENNRSTAMNLYKNEEIKLSELSRLKPYSIGASYELCSLQSKNKIINYLPKARSVEQV